MKKIALASAIALASITAAHAAPTVYGKDTVLIELNGHQIKALISSLALSMDVLDGEVEQEAMPYDLLDRLKVELDALIQRDKQSEEDA